MLNRRGVLALPLSAWLLAFFAFPLILVMTYSLLTRGPYGGVAWLLSWENYQRLLDPLYINIIGASLSLAALTSTCCLILGLPLAYVMATAPARWRKVLPVLVILPFLTSCVIRAQAVKTLFQGNGLVSTVLMSFGFIHQPLEINHSIGLVWFGMVFTYLPFMTLPLYVALEKFDFSLLEAARDLGARGHQVMLRVLLPQIKEAMIAGCVLVFIPSLGEFVIPDLLGGARSMLVGNLITEQFLKARDWPFGAALSVVLLAMLAMCFALEKIFRSSHNPNMSGDR